MEHEEYWEWMSADLDGELSPAQHAQLEEHLRTCPSCAQLYQDLSLQTSALGQLDTSLPPELHQNILDHLPPQLTVRRTQRNWKVWGSLASCLVLVAALGYASLPREPEDTAPATARSNPGIAPAVFSVQPQDLAVPGGDTVLLLSTPLPQSGLELLQALPTTTLDGGYVCCVADPDTTQTLVELLDQAALGYSQSPATQPDGSGDTAIVWPVG